MSKGICFGVTGSGAIAGFLVSLWWVSRCAVGTNKTSCRGQEVEEANADVRAFAYMSRRREVGRCIPTIIPSRVEPVKRELALDAVLRRSFRFGLTLGVPSVSAFALVKVLVAGGPPSPSPRRSPPERGAPRARPRRRARAAEHVARARPGGAERPGKQPAAKKATAKKAAAKASSAWVEPSGDVLPHVPPGEGEAHARRSSTCPGCSPNYDRTKPDPLLPRRRQPAEADGLRPVKR